MFLFYVCCVNSTACQWTCYYSVMMCLGNCLQQEEKVTNWGYLSKLALITIGNVKIVLSFLFISVRNSEITHLWKLPQLKSIWFSYKFFCWNSSARIKSVSSFKLLLRDSLREIGKEAQTPKANFITMKK